MFFYTCRPTPWVEPSVATRANKQNCEKRRNPKKSDGVAEVEHRHSNSVATLQYGRVNKSIIYITQYIKERHPPKCCLVAKHPKHSEMRVTNIKEKPVGSFSGTKRAFTLAPAMVEQTWVSSQMFSFVHNQ